MDEKKNKDQMPEEEFHSDLQPIGYTGSCSEEDIYDLLEEEYDDDYDEGDEDGDDDFEDEFGDDSEDDVINIVDPEGFVRLLENVIQVVRENNGNVSRAAITDIVSQCIDASGDGIEVEVMIPDDKIRAAKEEGRGKTLLVHLETLANDFGMTVVKSDDPNLEKHEGASNIINAVTDADMVGNLYARILDINTKIDAMVSKLDVADFKLDDLKQHVSNVGGILSDHMVDSTNNIVNSAAKDIKKRVRKAERRQIKLMDALIKTISRSVKHMTTRMNDPGTQASKLLTDFFKAFK